MKRDVEVDVVVVGAGSAGLAAAIASADAGARRIVVLDKAGPTEAGGNARFSHTGFRSTYAGADDVRPFLADLDATRFDRLVLPAYTAADFKADLDRATNGRIDPALRDRLAESAGQTMHWMLGLGLPWTLNNSLKVGDREHFEPGLVLAAGHGGGGLDLIEAWLGLARERGIAVRFDAPVIDIRLGTGDAHVVSVGSGSSEGRPATVATPALVVCSGGFQADPAARERYLGGAYAAAAVRGSRHDTGEVLELLLREGAGRDGSWDTAVVTPVDADSPASEGGNRMNRYSYPYGITVDRHGRRFFDEGAGSVADTYGAVGRVIIERADGRAFQLFDAVGSRYLKAYAYRHARVLEAGSVDELAAGLGIDGPALRKTISDFNRSIAADRPFDPTRPDGRATAGIEPPKSNWAVALREPPFSAYAVTGGVTFTLGGLRIDRDARVLDADGRPLPGVFASGDAVGLFHGNYPSGAGQTRNVVFGRLAGEGAARWAGQRTDAQARRAIRGAGPPVRPGTMGGIAVSMIGPRRHSGSGGGEN